MSGRIGLGCMAFTGIYGPVTRGTAIEIIRHAADMGVARFDTAELYGPYLNEELLSDALGNRLGGIEIATKFGYRLKDDKIVGLDSSPRSIRASVEGRSADCDATTSTFCTSTGPTPRSPSQTSSERCRNSSKKAK